MSTKKEKCLCCKEWNPACFCICHMTEEPEVPSHSQTEIIEWEKNLDYNSTDLGEMGKFIRVEYAKNILQKAITTAVAKDRELGNPYNSVSTWKEIGKNRGYWDFFKDQVISAREKEIEDEVEKIKTYTGGSSVNEKDKRVNKAEVLSILKH